MKRYRIIRTERADAPEYALVDESTDLVIRVDHLPRRLSDWAFGPGGGDEVRHEYDLRQAQEDETWER